MGFKFGLGCDCCEDAFDCYRWNYENDSGITVPIPRANLTGLTSALFAPHGPYTLIYRAGTMTIPVRVGSGTHVFSPYWISDPFDNNRWDPGLGVEQLRAVLGCTTYGGGATLAGNHITLFEFDYDAQVSDDGTDAEFSANPMQAWKRWSTSSTSSPLNLYSPNPSFDPALGLYEASVYE